MLMVRVLQQKAKITTGISTGVPLTHMSAYPICKEFPGLLSKPLYHSPLHIVSDVNEWILTLYVMVQTCQNHVRPGCMQVV
jgi:hypothetical protein